MHVQIIIMIQDAHNDAAEVVSKYFPTLSFINKIHKSFCTVVNAFKKFAWLFLMKNTSTGRHSKIKATTNYCQKLC